MEEPTQRKIIDSWAGFLFKRDNRSRYKLKVISRRRNLTDVQWNWKIEIEIHFSHSSFHNSVDSLHQSCSHSIWMHYAHSHACHTMDSTMSINFVVMPLTIQDHHLHFKTSRKYAILFNWWIFLLFLYCSWKCHDLVAVRSVSLFS